MKIRIINETKGMKISQNKLFFIRPNIVMKYSAKIQQMGQKAALRLRAS